MTRILVRSAKEPWLALSPQESLSGSVFAGNTGNLLFSQGVHEVLSVPGAEVVADRFVHDRVDPTAETAARINDEYDAFVIPLANAFRRTFQPELRRLTELVRGLDIPVVVVGGGAQTTPSATELPPEVREDTAAFLGAVLDRSARIGVRGDITRRCLAALGFGDEHVDVIGCPSLLAPSGQVSVRRRVPALTPSSPIAAHATLSQRRMGRILQRAAGRYPGLTYVPQLRTELRLLLRGEPVPGDHDPALPTTADHPLYRGDRIRMFVDPTTWTAFMSDQEFALGTRLHGTIAAVLAGTPAHLLTFDSRTLEVAEHHGLPHSPLGSVADDVDPAELYDRADFAAYHARRPGLVAHYAAFLTANGLAHVHEAGHENPDFGRRLAEVAFPGPVGPLSTVAPSRGRLDRLARLALLRRRRAVAA
jgi:hypothetical protein